MLKVLAFLMFGLYVFVVIAMIGSGALFEYFGIFVVATLCTGLPAGLYLFRQTKTVPSAIDKLATAGVPANKRSTVIYAELPENFAQDYLYIPAPEMNKGECWRIPMRKSKRYPYKAGYCPQNNTVYVSYERARIS